MLRRQPEPAPRLIGVKEVAARTGTPASTVYKWGADPTHPFPEPVKVSDGRKGVRWVESEIDAYIQAAIKRRDTDAAAVDRILRRTA